MGKYRHYRLVTEGEQVLPQGGVTVYYEEIEADTYQIGLAFCSLLDNFNRGVGRRIAEGRFSFRPITLLAGDRDQLNVQLEGIILSKFDRIQARRGRSYLGELR